MVNANLQSTSALRKKNLYGEAMSRSYKGMKKKKTYYSKGVKESRKSPNQPGLMNYTSKGGNRAY